MSDLEGLARGLIARKVSRQKVIIRLIQEILDFKEMPEEHARKLASAVITEVEASTRSLQDNGVGVLSPTISGITVGDQGVGCRGTGDFFVHRLVAELSETGNEAVLSPRDMDDAGAIEIGKGIYLVAKMEGMHSRLSDFPFLAGFHVTRAAFRDLLVKGAIPKGLIVDIHLADDADVGKLFDFMGGVACVCELVECPILGGSTLRIGGDMVIGDRVTGGVSAVGTAKRLLPRRDVREDDVIIMTEGAGGGTICTTAIYSGRPDIVRETLNIKFVTASKVLLESAGLPSIHCMADVTNGGIRADLHEIGEEAGFGAEVLEKEIISLSNPAVRKLLEENRVDLLGVSLDSLLVFCDEDAVKTIISELSVAGVKARAIGRTTEDRGIKIVRNDGVAELLPRFRESAYTEIKKVVDSYKPVDIRGMENRVRSSAKKSDQRRRRVVQMIRAGQPISGSGDPRFQGSLGDYP